MAQITVGSSGTLLALTAEGQAMELLIFLQKKEHEMNSGEDRVQASINLNNFTFNGSFSIPAIQAINELGQLVISANDYLPGVVFNGGSGGTFKSQTATQYLIEVINYLQLQEQSLAKNPNQENRVSAQYDIDTKLFTGNIRLNVNAGIDSSGSATISTTEYLLS